MLPNGSNALRRALGTCPSIYSRGRVRSDVLSKFPGNSERDRWFAQLAPRTADREQGNKIDWDAGGRWDGLGSGIYDLEAVKTTSSEDSSSPTNLFTLELENLAPMGFLSSVTQTRLPLSSAPPTPSSIPQYLKSLLAGPAHLRPALRPLLASLDTHRHGLSISSYNILLAYTYKIGDLASAREVLGRMSQDGVMWNGQTKDILLKGLMRRRRLMLRRGVQNIIADKSDTGSGVRDRITADAKGLDQVFEEDLEAILGEVKGWKRLRDSTKIILVDGLSKEKNKDMSSSATARAMIGDTSDPPDPSRTDTAYLALLIITIFQASNPGTAATLATSWKHSPLSSGPPPPSSPKEILRRWDRLRSNGPPFWPLFGRALPDDPKSISPRLCLSICRLGISKGLPMPPLPTMIEAIQELSIPNESRSDSLLRDTMLDTLHIYLRTDYPTRPRPLPTTLLRSFRRLFPSMLLSRATLSHSLSSLRLTKHRAHYAQWVVKWFMRESGDHILTEDIWTAMLAFALQGRNMKLVQWTEMERMRWRARQSCQGPAGRQLGQGMILEPTVDQTELRDSKARRGIAGRLSEPKRSWQARQEER